MKQDEIAPVGLNLDQAEFCVTRLQPLMCRAISESGAKTADLFFFYYKRIKTVSVALKARGCERMCAAEGVIKMETFAPNLLGKVATSL